MATADSNELHERNKPAHPPALEGFNRSVIIFVTVCTKDRHRNLANDALHNLLRAAWERADRWSVGRYILMPDHLHLFCRPATEPRSPLKAWVAYWKSLVTRGLSGLGTVGDGPGGTGPSKAARHKPFWQRDCWDTQLRRGENYHVKWEYVRSNPVRAGLCVEPHEWPYQGEMSTLEWHD